MKDPLHNVKSLGKKLGQKVEQTGARPVRSEVAAQQPHA